MAVLAKDADPEVRDRFDALRLTLAAIIQLQSAVDSAVQATPALARYYLRLAWLFHEVENLPDQEEAKAKTDSLIGQLKKVWSTVPENQDAALRMAIGLYELSLTESRVLADELDSVKVYLLVARLKAKLGGPGPGQELLEQGPGAGPQVRAEAPAGKTQLPGPADQEREHEELGQGGGRSAHQSGRGRGPGPGRGEQGPEIIDGYYGTDRKELRRMLADEGIDREVIDNLVPLKKGGLRGLLHKS